jgi:hypothetical protein
VADRGATAVARISASARRSMSCIQSNRQNECVQMPGKMARSDPRPSVRVTRGVGSGQHLASVLQEGRENANIDPGLGFICRISDESNLGRIGTRPGPQGRWNGLDMGLEQQWPTRRRYDHRSTDCAGHLRTALTSNTLAGYDRKHSLSRQ